MLGWRKSYFGRQVCHVFADLRKLFSANNLSDLRNDFVCLNGKIKSIQKKMVWSHFTESRMERVCLSDARNFSASQLNINILNPILSQRSRLRFTHRRQTDLRSWNWPHWNAERRWCNGRDSGENFLHAKFSFRFDVFGHSFVIHAYLSRFLGIS